MGGFQFFEDTEFNFQHKVQLTILELYPKIIQPRPGAPLPPPIPIHTTAKI